MTALGWDPACRTTASAPGSSPRVQRRALLSVGLPGSVLFTSQFGVRVALGEQGDSVSRDPALNSLAAKRWLCSPAQSRGCSSLLPGEELACSGELLTPGHSLL